MKRKLCVIIPVHWSVVMGGSPYQAKCLIERLISHERYDIYYLARWVAPGHDSDGYEAIKIAVCDWTNSVRPILDTPRLLTTLKKIRPDVIYQRVGCAYTGVVSYYARRNKCKVVWHIASDIDVLPLHKIQSKITLLGRIEKKILEYGLKHADHIIAQTRQQDNYLQIHYGRMATAVIPNFHPLPTESIKKEGVAKVVWIANIKRLKQPEIFIKLASDLQYIQGTKFIMIGAPSPNVDYQSSLELKANELTNFRYMGKCTQDEVNAVLAESDILVNTSHWEGFSNTFVQAWMRKVPVVSLNVNPDGVFDDERLGIFSGNFVKLRDDVARLIEDKGRRQEMGERAQEYAFANHSVRNIESLVDILDEK